MKKRHHLQALRELPADIVVPARLPVTAGLLDQVAAMIAKPRKPTRALRALMAGPPSK